jgi:hypothetical protein
LLLLGGLRAFLEASTHLLVAPCHATPTAVARMASNLQQGVDGGSSKVGRRRVEEGRKRMTGERVDGGHSSP